jgi:hypothetical protein
MANETISSKNGIKLDKFNDLFTTAQESERELYAEMRTNILLKNGNHYNKKSSNYIEQLRTRGVIPKESAKIRITKNHLHRILNAYENSILEHNPSTTVSPFNPDELSDTKAAMLGKSVVDWIKQTTQWNKKRAKYVSDLVTVGETFAKLSYDYEMGPQVIGEDGLPQLTGQFKIDKLYGFEVKVDPSARDFDEAKWVCLELIVDKVDLVEMLMAMGREEDIKKLENAAGGSYMIFDAQRGTHMKKSGKILLREWFFRPTSKRPNGWYALNTDAIDILQEELPLGIFPIYKCGFDDIENTPRSSSITRVCRPYQVEINRASSKMAEHQVTLGDDKVFIQSGTKLVNGGTYHGIRAMKFSGAMPVVQPGRSGEQYLNYIVQNINEMYQAVDMQELIQDKQTVGDPFLMLFESMKRKKKYAKYVEKYERFEVEIFTDALKMAKVYLNENHMIKIVGQQEKLNIAEFKKIDDSGFQVKVEAMSGDIETRFGKVLTTVQILQYAGSSLQPDQIGTLIKQLPYGNSEQIYDPLTTNYDSSVNDILAMDRGIRRDAKPFDNHSYMLDAFMNRIRKTDFEALPDEVKSLYQNRISQHEQFIKQQKEEAQRANQGNIPTDGFLTTVNASWQNPETGKVERIKVPSASVMWLSQQLQKQGFFTQLNGLDVQGGAALISKQQEPQVPQTIMPQA